MVILTEVSILGVTRSRKSLPGELRSAGVLAGWPPKGGEDAAWPAAETAALHH